MKKLLVIGALLFSSICLAEYNSHSIALVINIIKFGDPTGYIESKPLFIQNFYNDLGIEVRGDIYMVPKVPYKISTEHAFSDIGMGSSYQGFYILKQNDNPELPPIPLVIDKFVLDVNCHKQGVTLDQQKGQIILKSAPIFTYGVMKVNNLFFYQYSIPPYATQIIIGNCSRIL